MGFGASRTEARQIVRHNAILVNGKRVNMPSYQVRRATRRSRGESEGATSHKGAVAAAETRGFPEWIEVNAKEMKAGSKRSRRVRSAFHDQRKSGVELYSK